MNPLMWLRVALVLAPIVVWGVQELRIMWAVRAAVAETRIEQTKICNGRVAELESKINQSSFETVVTVQDGAAAAKPTPIEQLERQALCDADPLCRDRKKK